MDPVLRTAPVAQGRDLPGRVLLKAGARQPKAIGLYVSAGFVPIASYGHFSREPLSRCFSLGL